ncbi:FG-GAP-like repeat-containing protein [Candidatus Palauibacter sp.]|uniref:FG-GAP-like repeat-containing protein n=1 Tax=Candidatus Palauibacter sp. TaxID=3101350 RepID=UPI003C6FD44E
MTKTRNSALGTLSPGVAMAVCSAACGDPVTLPGPVPQPLPFVAVQSLTPAPNARAAPRDGALLITFDRPLDRSRPESLDVRVFGRWSGVAEVTLELGGQDRALRIRPSEPFAAGEEVTATLVAGSYGGTEGEFGLGHTWTFRTASAPGSFAQRGIATLPVRRPGEAHIQAYGAYAGDLNGDGDIGDGEWSCAPGDVNGDGLMDVFVGTRRSDEVITLASRGDGTFEALGRVSSGDAWMLASGDLDGDGRVDAAAVNGAAASLAILRGGPEGALSLAEEHPLDGFPLAIDAGDLDGDGDLDILTSDFDSGHFVIFENAGGRFLRRPEVLAARTAASCAILHDRDNDGDLDITGIDEIDDLLFLFENVGG